MIYDNFKVDLSLNPDTSDDISASEGKYVTVKQGTQSLSEPATGSADLITIPFTVSSNSVYNILLSSMRIICCLANIFITLRPTSLFTSDV